MLLQVDGSQLVYYVSWIYVEKSVREVKIYPYVIFCLFKKLFLHS